MYVNIYGKKYQMRQELTGPAKTLIRNTLNDVRKKSEMRGIPEFYVSFVVMMYVVSSSILSELSDSKIKKIVRQIEMEEKLENSGKSDLFEL